MRTRPPRTPRRRRLTRRGRSFAVVARPVTARSLAGALFLVRRDAKPVVLDDERAVPIEGLLQLPLDARDRRSAFEPHGGETLERFRVEEPAPGVEHHHVLVLVDEAHLPQLVRALERRGTFGTEAEALGGPREPHHVAH